MCCNIINQWLIQILISFLGSHLFPGTKLMAYFKPKLSLHTHLYISTTVPMTMEKIYKLEHCICCKVIITRASVNGKPESENATVFLAKRGVMVPGVSCVDCGNWGWEYDSSCYFRVDIMLWPWNYAVFCEERVAEIHVFYAHVTYKRTRCSW